MAVGSFAVWLSRQCVGQAECGRGDRTQEALTERGRAAVISPPHNVTYLGRSALKTGHNADHFLCPLTSNFCYQLFQSSTAA